MTDASNILSGSDNLWKYLFTVGVLLISISIFYPLKQSEIIDLKIVELVTDSRLLSKKIEHLNEDFKKFENFTKLSKLEIDSLKKSLKIPNVDSKIDQINIEIANEDKIIKNKIRNTQLLVIENEGKENYIIELKNQSNNYKYLFRLGIFFGLLLSIYGLYKWFMASLVSDKLRIMELDKKDLEELLKMQSKFNLCNLVYKLFTKKKIE